MLIQYFYQANTEKFEWREKHFDRLCGTDKIRNFIIERKKINEIKKWLDKDLEPFLPIRKKYLLY